MKKVLLVLLSISFTLTLSAQKKWKIGANISPLLSKYVYSDDEINKYPLTETSYGAGISTGIDVYRLYGIHFRIRAGLLLNLRSYNANYHIQDEMYVYTHRSIYSIILPLGLQYHFKIKQKNLFINTGFELSYAYTTRDKTNTAKYTNHYWNASEEIYFGIGYKFKLGEKHSFFINPEYSPKIFENDYSTFRLNLGIIFNNQ